MLIKLKAPAEQASGKQGSEIVYSSWRNTQVARSYAIPTNPKSTDQTLVRALLSAITKRWNTLSDADRQSWADYSASHEVKNRLGQAVRSTSLGMYTRVNLIHRLRQSSTWTDTAPTAGVPSTPSALTFRLAQNPGTSFFLDVEHSYTTLTGLYLLVYAQSLASPAVKADFRKQVLLCGAATGVSFKALAASAAHYQFDNARFTTSEGAVFGMSACIVDAYGQCSTPLTVVDTFHA